MIHLFIMFPDLLFAIVAHVFAWVTYFAACSVKSRTKMAPMIFINNMKTFR